MLAQRLRIPYAVALVFVGLLVEETHLVQLPQLEPSILLFVFLPALLFDSSFRQEASEVSQTAPGYLLLAVPGVLVTAAIVGLIVAFALHLPIAVGLLFGSIVSATDPIAVIA